MYPYDGRRRASIYRGRGGATQTGGYRSEPAGDGQGVWTPQERGAEQTRRAAADATAAATAEANMQAAINSINNNGSLTAFQKYQRLSALNYSGKSAAEYTMLIQARDAASKLL